MSKLFGRFAEAVARATGKPLTFMLSVVLIVIWAVTGPFFGFSDTWQLVINTGTTIVTFLMVFLIQNTQNRDGAAIQAKLDELIRASAAQNPTSASSASPRKSSTSFGRNARRAPRRKRRRIRLRTPSIAGRPGRRIGRRPEPIAFAATTPPAFRERRRD